MTKTVCACVAVTFWVAACGGATHEITEGSVRSTPVAHGSAVEQSGGESTPRLTGTGEKGHHEESHRSGDTGGARRPETPSRPGGGSSPPPRPPHK